MASGVFPAASSGGIKSVQRGLATAAGTVTITSVDITKSFVNIFGTTSSGTVAASGSINAISGTINAANGSVSANSGNNSQVGFNQGNNNPTYGTILTGANVASNIPGVTNLTGTINTSAQNISLNASNGSFNAANINAASNNLVSAVTQGYLSGSTSLEVSGACRWEVVEFN